MQDIVCTSSAVALPQPRVGPIAVRVATINDLPFLDGLQKQHNKALGFFPRAQLEGYVENQWILIAEDAATGTPLGYCASRDRYLKRDELGVIYQLCVTPDHQRGLIGASLIKAVFERSAYGCRLYCCWCAQDLAANYFWESLGFVPIAFRAGSTGKKRVHIFWQRRIDGDRVSGVGDRVSGKDEDGAFTRTPNPETRTPIQTPYWYPFQTNAGAIRADRIVFPIPPGVHWKDVTAVAVVAAGLPAAGLPENAQLDAPVALDRAGAAEHTIRKTKPRAHLAAKPAAVPLGGFCFQPERPAKQPKPKGTKATKAPPVKIDPKYLKGARELRDRYLEHVNDRLLIPASHGKYDVGRTLPGGVAASIEGPMPLLKAG